MCVCVYMGVCERVSLSVYGAILTGSLGLGAVVTINGTFQMHQVERHKSFSKISFLLVANAPHIVFYAASELIECSAQEFPLL